MAKEICLPMKVGLSDADKDKMEDSILAKTNGGPRAVFDTLEQLKEAYPDGTYGIFLVLQGFSDGHHYYYWKENQWQDGGLYLGSGLISDVEAKIKEEAQIREMVDNAIYGDIAIEEDERTAKDNELQKQIDALVNRSDVVAVVGSKADLDMFDVSTITINDIVKVLKDETKDNAETYYKLISVDPIEWKFIGSIAESYSKAEADQFHDTLSKRITTNKVKLDQLEPRVNRNETNINTNITDITQLKKDLTYNKVGILKVGAYNENTGIIEYIFDENVDMSYNDETGILTITYN